MSVIYFETFLLISLLLLKRMNLYFHHTKICYFKQNYAKPNFKLLLILFGLNFQKIFLSRLHPRQHRISYRCPFFCQELVLASIDVKRTFYGRLSLYIHIQVHNISVNKHPMDIHFMSKTGPNIVDVKWTSYGHPLLYIHKISILCSKWY